jgi:hypothetical protein
LAMVNCLTSLMKLRLAPGLTIKPSSIHGKGCFATQAFYSRHKIAEYAVKGSPTRSATETHRKTLRICEVNRRWSLDGSRGGNGTHYINHSCRPNAFMQILYDHILFIPCGTSNPARNHHRLRNHSSSR